MYLQCTVMACFRIYFIGMSSCLYNCYSSIQCSAFDRSENDSLIKHFRLSIQTNQKKTFHFHCRSQITVTAARHFYDFAVLVVVVVVVVHSVAVSDAYFFCIFLLHSTNRINVSNWNMALYRWMQCLIEYWSFRFGMGAFIKLVSHAFIWYQIA